MKRKAKERQKSGSANASASNATADVNKDQQHSSLSVIATQNGKQLQKSNGFSSSPAPPAAVKQQMVRYKIGTPSTGNAPSCSSSSNNNINGNGSDSGDDQMKLIASVEMTFKSTGGAGGAGGTIIHQKIETTTEQGSTTKLVSKSKSRSPIALHQRCGVPVPIDWDGDEVMPHSTKSLKHQDITHGKKVSTVASGRVGPISFMVRAGPGHPTMMNGHGEEDSDSDIDSNGHQQQEMGKAGPQMLTNGESAGAGGSSNAGNGNGNVEIEQHGDERQPALVKIQARKVNCKSSDGEMFVVDWYLMQQSKLFKRSWEEHRQSQKKKSSNGRSRKFIFNMETIDSTIFRRVLEWLEQHDGMDDPVVREDPQTGDRIWFELTEFERNFFDQPLHILNNLLTAGKALDIPSLYLFGCQSMAAMIQSKSPAEIRDLLGLQNDLTSTDIAAIRRRNRKFKMRELKAARYANRLQQLQSQLNQMGLKGQPQCQGSACPGCNCNPNRNPRVKNAGPVKSGSVPPEVVAEQWMQMTGRDILTDNSPAPLIK